jgi:hypothetical protein
MNKEAGKRQQRSWKSLDKSRELDFWRSLSWDMQINDVLIKVCILYDCGGVTYILLIRTKRSKPQQVFSLVLPRQTFLLTHEKGDGIALYPSKRTRDLGIGPGSVFKSNKNIMEGKLEGIERWVSIGSDPVYKVKTTSVYSGSFTFFDGSRLHSNNIAAKCLTHDDTKMGHNHAQVLAVRACFKESTYFYFCIAH